MSEIPAAILIGASAGSVDALMKILPALPAGYPFPILVVVHLSPNAKSIMSEIFAPRCALRVKEAEDKESLQPGTIYFAPPNYHLLVEEDETLALSSDEPVLFSRPAIDILFESAADAYGEGAVGIVLTGANEDGTHGLQAIDAAGGTCIVQDASQAQAPQMPAAALKRTPSAQVLSLQEIAQYLNQIALL